MSIGVINWDLTGPQRHSMNFKWRDLYNPRRYRHVYVQYTVLIYNFQSLLMLRKQTSICSGFEYGLCSGKYHMWSLKRSFQCQEASQTKPEVGSSLVSVWWSEVFLWHWSVLSLCTHFTPWMSWCVMMFSFDSSIHWSFRKKRAASCEDFMHFPSKICTDISHQVLRLFSGGDKFYYQIIYKSIKWWYTTSADLNSQEDIFASCRSTGSIRGGDTSSTVAWSVQHSAGTVRDELSKSRKAL